MTQSLRNNAEIRPALPWVRTILVFAMNLLGDSICRLPAIRAAKQTYPDSRVIVVADPRYREVFEGQPFISEVWPLDRTGANLAQVTAWFRVVRGARRARPDLVLDVYGSKRTALASRLSGARWCAGLYQGGLSRRYSLRPNAPLPQSGHIIEQINAAAAPAAIRAEFRYVPIAVSDADRARARGVEGAAGAPVVLLNPSARVQAKRWAAERFGQLAAALSAQAGLRCAVITAPGEDRLTEQVVAAADGAAAPLPELTIKQLAALMQMAAVVVTGDTGVLHLATAMGAPSVILAGPTDPRLVAYPGVKQAILFHREACADWVGAEQCATHNECSERRCIEAISVEEVVAAVKTVLGLGGRSA